jgi:DNA-binding MarR family transcriptional regulator
MARVEQLNAAEDHFWRALMRITLSLSRRMDGDLRRAVGISANEYVTLMSVYEAAGQELRMRDLAVAAALSASRTTRLVSELQARGLLSKRGCAEDGRGCMACLTPTGLVKLKAASSVHVSSVRALLFDHVDHVDPATTDDAAQVLSKIATRL